MKIDRGHRARADPGETAHPRCGGVRKFKEKLTEKQQVHDEGGASFSAAGP
jgi:hypothetical protein